MDTSTQIADQLTIGDWLLLRRLIENAPERTELWDKAYIFFEARINTRYLKPIEAIEKNSKYKGDGFAVVAIICSLIEALETFREGKTYRRASKNKPLDKENEYFQSQPMFENFLKKREPFKASFSKNGLATSFYENVRCAVLHEAATRNGWKIRINTGHLVEERKDSIILNRKLLVDSIREYMKCYKIELLDSPVLKKAYLRKMDSICETA